MLTPLFLMRQQITIEDWEERGVSGEVYAAPKTYRCRVNLKAKHTHKMSGNPENLNIVAGTVFLPAGTVVPMHSRATFNGNRYKVISCLPCYDMAGVENHVEVELQ